MHERILVVDDDKQIVRLVRSYLEKSGYEVLTAYDGPVALHTIRRERPDLAVLDVMLPGMDGREITRIVRSDAQLSRLPIIMLTAQVEDTDKIVGLELGADDYITKPFNPAEVVARVRSLLRRTVGVAPTKTVLTASGITLDTDSRVVTVDGASVDITPTEFGLLQALVESPGRAFSRQELLEVTGDVAFAGTERAVDSHIKNIRKKIEADPQHPVRIVTVYGVGYRLQDAT